MAQEFSFDVVSKPDPQEVDNAVNQALKELATRFDFRGSTATLSLDKAKKEILLTGESENRLASLMDILRAKLIKRGISPRAVEAKDPEPAGGSTWKQTLKLVEGIPQDKAKRLVALLKESKIKVQASIQGDQLRVSGKSKDDLQEAMAKISAADIGLDVTFTNFK